MDREDAERRFAEMLEQAGLPRFATAVHDPAIHELRLVCEHGLSIQVDLTCPDLEPIDEDEQAAILGHPYACADGEPLDVLLPGCRDVQPAVVRAPEGERATEVSLRFRGVETLVAAALRRLGRAQPAGPQALTQRRGLRRVGLTVRRQHNPVEAAGALRQERLGGDVGRDELRRALQRIPVAAAAVLRDEDIAGMHVGESRGEHARQLAERRLQLGAGAGQPPFGQPLGRDRARLVSEGSTRTFTYTCASLPAARTNGYAQGYFDSLDRSDRPEGSIAGRFVR